MNNAQQNISKKELRDFVRSNLDHIIQETNKSLSGLEIEDHEGSLKRLGRGGNLPHWYKELKEHKCLPNLDGKTVGSVVEMLLVSVVESHLIKNGFPIDCLKLNPARGVDMPDLDLSIKSPSENYCTSEPFYSAYERLVGGEYDIIVLLTDYQTAKSHPPLKLQIKKWQYLNNTQIADQNLCKIAKHHRTWLLDKEEAWMQKLFKFLAYVNQSDWRAKHLINLVATMDSAEETIEKIEIASKDFNKKNAELTAKNLETMDIEELAKINKISDIKPLWLGVLDAADNWVIDNQKDFARFPNENELNRLKRGPLDGKIGMSFALQWRYNFGRLFNSSSTEEITEI